MARERFQTLTEQMYYILLSLTEERYGYEIMQTISDQTSGRVKIGPGTLYALLSRFEKEELIKQVSDDGRRKTYIISEDGRKLLSEEYTRLRMLVEDGSRVLFNKPASDSINIPDSGQEESVDDSRDSASQATMRKRKRRNDDILL